MSDETKAWIHPEDAAVELGAAKFSASAAARELALERAKDLPALLTTYADGDAHELLDELREWFWLHPKSDFEPIWTDELRARLAELAKGGDK